MTAELDQGDVVAAKPVPILETDVYRDVYDKLVQLVPDLFDGFVDFLRDTNARSKPQDPAQASYFRNDRAIHRRISWLQLAAEEVHNLVRACDSRAFFFAEDREIRVLRTSWSPGTVVDVIDDQPVVAARNGFVRLEQLRQSLRRAVVFRIGQILS
jgi:methionyl-tRNA formyltransferase